MATMQELQTLPGVSDFFSLINFLTDVKKFETHMNRLEEKRNEINELLKTFGDVSNVQKIRDEAGLKLNQAREILDNAKAEAKQIVEGAKDDVTLQKKLTAEAKEQSSELRKAQAKVKKQLDVNADLEGKLKVKLASLDAEYEKLKAKQEEYEKKLKVISEAAKSVA